MSSEPDLAVVEKQPSPGEADTSMLISSLDASQCLSQTQSPLFSVLPAEIRNLIFYYALLPYEDEEQKYDANTCYVRPGYRSPRRIDIAILQTCQRVYREAWFRPWASNELTLFFSSEDRAPVRHTTIESIRQQLNLLARAGVDINIAHVRIFAQMWILEAGEMPRSLYSMENFKPRMVTIAIRHTDWWYWETDEPLRFANSITTYPLPNSVTSFNLELETLGRKKGQLDSVVAQIRAGWYFRRQDGSVLESKTAPDISTWRGSSVWNNKRWQRDEVSDMQLEYYVARVKWQLVRPQDVGPKHALWLNHVHAINPGARISGAGLPWPPLPPRPACVRRVRRVRRPGTVSG